jgi:hypothetical protein
LEELASVFLKKRELSLNSLNLGSNKVTSKGITKMFEALNTNGNIPVSHLVLNNNDLQISKKNMAPSAYYAFTKSIVTYLSQSKNL